MASLDSIVGEQDLFDDRPRTRAEPSKFLQVAALPPTFGLGEALPRNGRA
jgi:hypothetical protein